MPHTRITVVSVPSCRPSATSMAIETDQGEHLELAMTPDAFRQWSDGCECPAPAADRIDIVGVRDSRPSAKGAEVELETAQGERLALSLSPQALAQCVARCTEQSVASTAVQSFNCTSGAEHVLMTIKYDQGRTTEFLMSHGEAVLLAVNLLQAAKDAREQGPES